jgi:hypothetical protein
VSEQVFFWLKACDGLLCQLTIQSNLA